MADAARWLDRQVPAGTDIDRLRRQYQSLLLEKIAFNPSIAYMDLLSIHREGYLHIWPFGMKPRSIDPCLLAVSDPSRAAATQPASRGEAREQAREEIAGYYRYYDAITSTEEVPAIGLILAAGENQTGTRQPSAEPDAEGATILHVHRGNMLWRTAVRPGNRLVAIDGSPIKADQDRSHLYAQLAGSERLELTVAKPGRRIQVIVQPPSAKHVSYLVPLYVEGTRWGVMRLVLSTTDLRRHVTASLRRLQEFKGRTLISFVFLVAIAFLLGLAVMSVLGRRLAAPIHDLTRHIKRYRETGDLEGLDQIPPRARNRRDEVGSLGQAIAELAARLKTMVGELRNKTRQLQEEARAKDEAYQQLAASQTLMQESARMTTLGKMGASVAHEINNRLHPMKLHAESLLMDFESGRPMEVESIRTILAAIDRCYRFTETFKQFARRSKPATWQTERVNINHAIREVLDLAQKQMEWSHVEVSFDPRSARQVRADPNELGQVALNLLLNAAEAIQSDETGTSPRVGRIQIRTFDQGDNVVFEIEDNGPGMPPEVQARLFEPFFTTKEPLGTGLGLAVSKQIIDRYLGRIDVDSELGRGTVFRVSIPAAQEPATS